MDVRSCNCNGWVRLVRVTNVRACEPEPRPAGEPLFASYLFMWTFTRSVKIHILRSCSFPDWDVNFGDNSCQRFRKLSRVFGKSEVLEGVNVKLDVNPGNELPMRRNKESITHAKYLTFIYLYICMAFD